MIKTPFQWVGVENKLSSDLVKFYLFVRKDRLYGGSQGEILNLELCIFQSSGFPWNSISKIVVPFTKAAVQLK
jgi:hypothetical protein